MIRLDITVITDEVEPLIRLLQFIRELPGAEVTFSTDIAQVNKALKLAVERLTQ